MPFMLLAAKAKFWRGRNVHQTFVPLQHSPLLLLLLLLPWTKFLKAWFWQLSLEPLSLPAKRQSADCFMKEEFKNKLLDISNLNKMECMMGLKVFIRTLWHRQWYCLNWNACRFRTLKIGWCLKGHFYAKCECLSKRNFFKMNIAQYKYNLLVRTCNNSAAI